MEAFHWIVESRNITGAGFAQANAVTVESSPFDLPCYTDSLFPNSQHGSHPLSLDLFSDSLEPVNHDAKGLFIEIFFTRFTSAPFLAKAVLD